MEFTNFYNIKTEEAGMVGQHYPGSQAQANSQVVGLANQMEAPEALARVRPRCHQ